MSQFKRFVPSFGIAIVIIYFSYHTFSGEQSVVKWLGMKKAENIIVSELNALNITKDDLEKQNALLRNASLDLDYLDERVREKLNYIMPSDMVIVLK